MTRAIIIEDETIAVKHLQRLISTIDKRIEICEVFDTIQDSVAWLKENDVDLIFQDIHLADGNSFGIFEQVEVHAPIIFTTAYDEFAIKAFKHNGIDYLLKPIDKDELNTAIQKYNHRFLSQKKKPDFDYTQLAKLLQPQQHYRKRFLVKIGPKIKTITIEEVAYFHVKDKMTHLTTKENRTYPIDFSLTQLADLLDPDQFFRINRQFLVNQNAIKEMVYLSSVRLRLILIPEFKHKVLVSIDKIGEFKRWLDR